MEPQTTSLNIRERYLLKERERGAKRREAKKLKKLCEEQGQQHPGADSAPGLEGVAQVGPTEEQIEKLPVELRPLATPSEDEIQVEKTTMLGPFTPGEVLEILRLLTLVSLSRRWEHLLQDIKRDGGWRVKLLVLTRMPRCRPSSPR